MNHPLPERWMAEVEARGQGLAKQRTLDLHESLGELIATGIVDMFIFLYRVCMCISSFYIIDLLECLEVQLKFKNLRYFFTGHFEGLRRREGIHSSDWNRASSNDLNPTSTNLLPFSTFLGHLYSHSRPREDAAAAWEGVDELQGLAWTEDRIWLTEAALDIADHIIPSVYFRLLQITKPS